MRRTLPALLLACALLACRDEPPPVAPRPQPAPLAVRAQGTVDALLADWTPPTGVAARVNAWSSPDAVEPAVTDRPPTEWVPLIRAALRRADGPVSRRAAAHVDARHFDRGERLRATRLIVDAVVRGESNSLWNLLATASAADLRAEILPRLREAPVEHLGDNQLGAFHKLMRAGDLPAVCEWFLTTDPPLPAILEGDIEIVAWHTTEHREDVARVILRGRTVPPDDARGLPEPLVEVLRLLFPPDDADKADVGRYDGWALQWLADEVPAARDAALLARIATATEHPVVQFSLRHVASEPAAAKALGSSSEPAALAALAAAGDTDALSRLRQLATDDYEALAHLLVVAPDAGRGDLLVRLGDPETAAAALEDLSEVFDEYRFRAGLDLDARDLAPLAVPLLASRCPPDVLLGCATVIPALWSVECAERVLGQLRSDHAEVLADLHPTQLVLLELTRRDALVDLLRASARGSDAYARDAATPLLAVLGDSESGDVIAPWVEQHGDEDGAFLVLGRVDHPAVRGLLRRYAANDDDAGREALHALAELEGLPRYVNLPSDGLDAGALERVRELVLAGQPTEAFVLQCELDPLWVHEHAGDIDDARVTEYLRARVARRAQDDYLYAVQELAAQGDPEARATVLAAVRDGDYRWTEEIHPRPWMLERGVAGLQAWADLAESNCCLVPNGEGKVFRTWGAPLGHWPEPGWSNHGHGDPPATRMRTWFAEWGPELVHSDLLSTDAWPEYAPRPRGME